MRINLTDQFLWEVYNFLEKGESFVYFVTKRHTLYDIMPGDKNPIIAKYRKLKNRKRFDKLIYYLKKYNLIKIKNLQGNKAIILTKKGEEKALNAGLWLEGSDVQKRKDGKWIMVAFDIPKNRKRDRGLLRSVLINLGYKMFQYSIWVTPKDIYEKTEKILKTYFLDKYVRIFLVEEL